MIIKNGSPITWSASNEFYVSLVEIADLGDLRVQMNTLPSHWWWYLDKLVQNGHKAVAV